MKACLSLTLLCFVAYAHGAILALQTTCSNADISKEEKSCILKKAGEAIGNLGKLIQRETGSTSMEELRSNLEDLHLSGLLQLKDTSDKTSIGRLFIAIGNTIGSFGNIMDEGLIIQK